MDSALTMGAGAAAGFGVAQIMDMPFEVAAIMAGLMAFGGYIVKNQMGGPAASPAAATEAPAKKKAQSAPSRKNKKSKSKKKSNKKKAAVSVQVAKEQPAKHEASAKPLSKNQKKRLKQKAAKKKERKEKERKAREERERKEREERERKENERKAREAEERRKANETAKAKAEEEARATATKKKKKKKKKNKKQHQSTLPEIPVQDIDQEEDNGAEWIVQKNHRSNKKNSKKASAGAADDNKTPQVPQGLGEIQIPAKSQARVIGSGGCNIKGIEAATGCKIQMPKKGSGNNWAIINGPKSNIDAVKAALKELINKGYSELTHPGMIHGSVSVPQNKRAQVIGRKGVFLKAIKKATEVRIDMPDKEGDDDVVTILGSENGVQLAKRAIAELRDHGFSFITHPDTVRIKFDFPFNKVRHIVGPSGATIKTIQKNTGTNIDTPNSMGEPITITGTEQGCQQAKASIMAILAMPLEIEETIADWATVDETLNAW